MPILVTPPQGGFSSFPSFLANNRRFVYFRSGPTRGLFTGSLDEIPEHQSATPLLSTEAGGAYVRTSSELRGYLFFVRDRTLMAQAFDTVTLRLGGEPISIDRVATVNEYPAFSAAGIGAVLFRDSFEQRFSTRRFPTIAGLAGLALVVAYTAARRATRVNPLEALRSGSELKTDGPAEVYRPARGLAAFS